MEVFGIVGAVIRAGVAVVSVFGSVLLWVFVVGEFIGDAFGAGCRFAGACGEGDASARDIDFEDTDGEFLSDLDDIVGVFDEVVGEFGDMDQAVLVDADVNESTEGGDVGDDAFELHVGGEVLDIVDIVAELGGFKGGAGVATGFFEFVDDIAEGGFADIIAEVTFDLDLLDECGVADESADIDAEISGHLFDEGVSFGVNSGSIERVLAAANTEEASGLFKGFCAKAGDFE